ncbi:hypothetical protein LshimejAT787_1001740 [Lyophyllum shimeji]|uniref:Uncharacterized protein n=1 Tax=Lyophyllum shimeji TaxID=47721 RepID=A0A9P3UNF9_LYOSH|nr:hypothetical protein LshimejAT787_1001740 [Lyophyllum shimeji]
MGVHQNPQIHRRAAAKQRRLTVNEAEEALLKSLVARFSPTAVYTETDSLFTDPATNTPTDTTTTPPPLIPTTTPPPAPTTPTTTPPANTVTTSPQAQPTTTTGLPPVQQTTANTDTNVVTPPPVLVTTSPIITSPTRTFSTTGLGASTTSSAPSSTTSSSPGSGTNVGGIVGGIAGALLGLAVLVFVVRFIMKRQRDKDDNSAAAFNASDFRRSAVLMNDPPTHDETVERGFNPRPPTMIQRKLASPAPTFGTQYGAPGPYGALDGAEYGNMDQYGQYQSFAPGQVINAMSPPVSATSAHPMYHNPAYGQSPFSPIGSPVSAMGPGYDGGPAPVLTRQPSSATQPSRQLSAGSVHGQPYPDQANLSAPNEYVDLDRSSVTPFQAAQYAEISQRLNTPVPAGLDTPAVAQFVQSGNGGAPPVPANDSSSPFADPVPFIPAALLAGGGAAANTRPTSADSVTQALDNFPAPPSPAHSTRVDLAPPMLPEIKLESRVASYDFPTSVRESPLDNVTKDFMKSPLGSQFPATPSPLASSFEIASPPAAATSYPAAPVPEVKAEAKQEQKKRPDTVYDDDDAYGGI